MLIKEHEGFVCPTASVLPHVPTFSLLCLSKISYLAEVSWKGECGFQKLTVSEPPPCLETAHNEFTLLPAGRSYRAIHVPVVVTPDIWSG